MTSVFFPLITGTYWQTFLLVCLFISWLSSHMKWVFWCEPSPGMVLIDLINQTLRGFQESCVFVRNTVFLIGIAESCCAHNWVIVKKSSPKNLLADCRSSVGRLSAVCWPTVGRLLADCWPTVGRLSADRWPTGLPQNIDYQSADSRPTNDRQSADSW